MFNFQINHGLANLQESQNEENLEKKIYRF